MTVIIFYSKFIIIFFIIYFFCDINKNKYMLYNRLQKELMVLMMSTEKGVSAFPDGENLFKWIGTIIGPQDTVILLLS